MNKSLLTENITHFKDSEMIINSEPKKIQNLGRLHFIDWLRVIAIAILIVFHAAIVFMPYAYNIGYIQSEDSAMWLLKPMFMVCLWRIPLLFLISGIGVYFAMNKRTWKQLISERSKRILLPFIFGIVLVVPLQAFIYHSYYNMHFSYKLESDHLWFLGNIFIYVLIMLPLFYYLKKFKNGLVYHFLLQILGNPIGVSLLALSFIIETQIFCKTTFENFAGTWHAFFLGIVAFILGFLFAYIGKQFWLTVLTWRWGFFAIALSLCLARYLYWGLYSPKYLMAAESYFCIITILGFGFKYLNHPSDILMYLSKASYPVYIVHQLFLFIGAYLILPLQIVIWVKFILTIVFTFVSSLIIFEFIIRRFWLTRVCFGLKEQKKIIPVDFKLLGNLYFFQKKS